MNRIERLQAMEALWDSLIDKESEIKSPEWHRDILEERKRNIESGKAELISLEKMRASHKLEKLLFIIIKEAADDLNHGKVFCDQRESGVGY